MLVHRSVIQRVKRRGYAFPDFWLFWWAQGRKESCRTSEQSDQAGLHASGLDTKDLLARFEASEEKIQALQQVAALFTRG